MKYIELSQGKRAIIDDCDYEVVSEHNWHIEVGYAGTRTYFNGQANQMLMHRMILGAKKGESVDHINGDRLDNRRENIRLCTHQQNMCNTKKNSKNTSGYKGVDWHKATQKWRVKIQIHGKSIHIGLFKDKFFAASAYNEAALKYHGEFARINE